MKTSLFAAALLVSAFTVQAQEFPSGWKGKWTGELNWFKTGSPRPQTVKMEITIADDSAGQYSWKIIYGDSAADIRPYILKARDASKGHWVIDEKNGIILDQFWVAGRLTGAFTVGNNTIINSYYIKKRKLVVEFYSLGAKSISRSGAGNEESPFVDSYKIGSYQRALLKRKH